MSKLGEYMRLRNRGVLPSPPLGCGGCGSKPFIPFEELAGRFMTQKEIRRSEGLPDQCQVCGGQIRVMAFLGTDYCSQRCQESS